MTNSESGSEVKFQSMPKLIGKPRFSSTCKVARLHLTQLPALISAVLLTLGSNTALGYHLLLDTGDVQPASQYRVSVAPQFILNNLDGVNLVSFVDMPINESQAARAHIGVGKVDFQIGGTYKFVPFPDTKKQPAIGAIVGATYAKIGSLSEFSLRVSPVFSKRFATEVGDIIGYAGLPFGFTSRSGTYLGESTFVPVHLTGGAEFQLLNLPKWAFTGELGLNVNKAFSYIALSAAYQFQYSAKK